jgi:hypothetical protein
MSNDVQSKFWEAAVLSTVVFYETTRQVTFPLSGFWRGKISAELNNAPDQLRDAAANVTKE